MVAAEASVFLLVDHGVDQVIAEALLLLLVAENSGVLVWVVGMDRRHEGCGTVADEGTGRDE